MSTVGMPAWSREELESYLKAHFRPRPVEELRPVSASKARPEYYKKADLSSKQAADLSELLGELGSSFHERLFALIDESGMTDVSGLSPEKKHSHGDLHCAETGYCKCEGSAFPGRICIFSGKQE